VPTEVADGAEPRRLDPGVVLADKDVSSARVDNFADGGEGGAGNDGVASEDDVAAEPGALLTLGGQEARWLCLTEAGAGEDMAMLALSPFSSCSGAPTARVSPSRSTDQPNS
jgi:hypothetical protein